MLVIKLIAGLILLVVGAEALVRGASKIAAAVGISPLVIGLTIVAFGTSAPELAVSVMASLDGQTDLALGNVVGSNIFNVLFILGVSALVAPLAVAQQLIRLDVPIMVGVSLLTLLMASNGVISPWEGLILVTLGIIYTVFLIRLSKKEKSRNVREEYREAYGDEPKRGKDKTWFHVLLVLAGLGLLLFGSHWLVESAVALANSLGVSNLVIGLTIIAAGTSLPEVATSVIATVRGERDIAVGNVVGSSIFNIVYILGFAAAASEHGIAVDATALHFDLPVMVAVAFSCMPIFFAGKRLNRWKGLLFLGYYIAYTTYLVLATQRNASLETFTTAMIWFVIPLTILTLGVITVREFRKEA